jgi:hypothetical protein
MKTISRNAFRFCKLSVAVMIWCSFAFREEILLMVVFLMLLFSALLKVTRAPLILLYSTTLERIFPGATLEVDEKALRFAHALGTFLSGMCLVFIYAKPSVGWWMVLAFAILKTVSTLGFCPGEAIYSCYVNGTCSIFKT